MNEPLIPHKHQHVKAFSYRLRKYVNLGLPSILCFLMMIVQEQINIVFIGSLNDPTKLAGIGLGNMVLNLFANGILIGVNTALETFVS